MKDGKWIQHESWVFWWICDLSPSYWKVQLLPNLRAISNTSCMYRSWSTVPSSKVTKGEYSFGTYSKPDHNIFRKLLYFLDVTYCISSCRTWSLDSLVLEVVNSIDAELCFVGKQKSRSFPFRKVRSYLICKLQSFLFLVFRKFWVNFFLQDWSFRSSLRIHSLSACRRYSQITRNFTRREHS